MNVYIAIEVGFDYYRYEEFMGAYLTEEAARDSTWKDKPVVVVGQEDYLKDEYFNPYNQDSNDHTLIIIKEL